jgi:hypothetical protein
MWGFVPPPLEARAGPGQAMARAALRLGGRGRAADGTEGERGAQACKPARHLACRAPGVQGGTRAPPRARACRGAPCRRRPRAASGAPVRARLRARPHGLPDIFALKDISPPPRAARARPRAGRPPSCSKAQAPLSRRGPGGERAPPCRGTPLATAGRVADRPPCAYSTTTSSCCCCGAAAAAGAGAPAPAAAPAGGSTCTSERPLRV